MEQMYQAYMPQAEDSAIYKAEQDAAKQAQFSRGIFGPFGGLFGFGESNPIVGYTSSGDPIYQNQPQSSPFGFGFNQGGMVGAAGGEFLEDGSFVIDARTVSEIGNGSSEAGQELLAQLGGRPVKGPGDGVSDSIPATIEGNQEAAVARDEVIFDPQSVAAIGDGDMDEGARRLYAMMDQVSKARKKANRGEDSGAGIAALAAAGAV
jgi:hypothetical protein